MPIDGLYSSIHISGFKFTNKITPPNFLTLVNYIFAKFNPFTRRGY